MEWINVNTDKPVIAEGKSAVQVLVTLHDPIYEEIRPGHGSYTTNAMWDGEGFKQLACGPNDWSWVYCIDIPTHWQYFPGPAKAPDIKTL